jgi:hypothetical protein
MRLKTHNPFMTLEDLPKEDRGCFSRTDNFTSNWIQLSDEIFIEENAYGPPLNTRIEIMYAPGDTAGPFHETHIELIYET